MKGLFVGLTTLDLSYYIQSLPVEDSKSYSNKQVIIPGGMAMNASIAFSSLGADSSLITIIGKRFRSFIDDYLESIEQNIDIQDIVLSESQSLPIASIIINISNGSRTIFNPPLSNFSISSPEIDLAEYEIVMVDGFYPELAIPIARNAKEHNIPVVMDSGSWKPQMDLLLKFVDYLIVPRSFRPPHSTSFEDAKSYLSSYGFKGLAFTDGANHVLACQNNTDYFIDPIKITCKDSLAAGDIMHGAFCYHYLHDHNFLKSLEAAMLTASESCKYDGPHEWIKNL